MEGCWTILICDNDYSLDYSMKLSCIILLMALSTDRTSFCRHQVACKCWSFHNNDFFFPPGTYYIFCRPQDEPWCQRANLREKNILLLHSNSQVLIQTTAVNMVWLLVKLRSYWGTFGPKNAGECNVVLPSEGSMTYGLKNMVHLEKRLVYPENVKSPWASLWH
jgi:hypothetical protein